tara:strand:+ start:1188 stop:2027 length:840 start_codon:yes stop_codon:yes gene_type:complete
MSTINELQISDVQSQPEVREIITHEASTAMTPTERIEQNSDLLKALAPVIKDKHLAHINGKNYMCVGGGTSIATALGYLISTTDPVWDKEKKAWKSCSTLVDPNSTNPNPPVAWGFVGDDEPRWMNGPKFALYSMVQTRSAARVCRQNFGHMYVGLGADSETPAEEMSGVVNTQQASAPIVDAPASPVANASSQELKQATIKVDHVKQFPFKSGNGFHNFIVSTEGVTYKTWHEKVYEEAKQYAGQEQSFEIQYIEEEYQGRVTNVLDPSNGWKMDIPF